jgi:lipopolysaccharide/colanic/teichoic acid biosynthesis glycosyltransferase
MTPARRLVDIVVALVLSALLALPVLLLLGVLLAAEGRPLFHLSERMRAPGRPFRLVKLRSMRPDPADQGVSGGDKTARITRVGRLLRSTRLDEVPQLWNVLRGDMSLVGPRPPLRRYVEAFPDLYARVLHDRPGITGLATLHFHAAEERILAACRTPEETEAAYVRRCIPRKARLDLIYQRRRTLCSDMMLLGQTTGRLLMRPFRRRSA